MYTLKNNLLIVAVLFMSNLHGSAQVVDIPDTNFLNFLIKKGFDTNSDNKIQLAEVENVEFLPFNISDIAVDFKGLEAFKNLKKFMSYAYFKVPYDFGQNKLLEDIQLFDCGGVTELKIGDNPNLLSLQVFDAYQLQTIDVRNSPDLARLVVQGYNVTKIYVYDKVHAQRMGKLGLYPYEIPQDAYEAPNTILGIEVSNEIKASQILQKGTQLELGTGILHDIKGNIVMTVATPTTFNFDHFPVGLYFFKTTKGSVHKLVSVE